nr:hypothetical protein L203_05604 [Cryptococcus depauperatus CBS 7841]
MNSPTRLKQPQPPVSNPNPASTSLAKEKEDNGEQEELLENVDLNAGPDAIPNSDHWKSASSRDSHVSFASSSAQRLSGEVSTPATEATMLTMDSGETPIVLGVAIVDFNHLIGPTVEFAYPQSLLAALADDERLSRVLPFLALPDGSHLANKSEEDYSYFHCTYTPTDQAFPTNIPSNQTLFGISCNRQLASSELLKRPSDVTRSMVQKAVIVIASQPVFVSLYQLGVVTRAYFAQRDFTHTKILEDFYNSLENSLKDKSGEEAIYMGSSLRELVHKFRHRTLILLKLLMLQKRLMLYGYPVEKLCTYQYSLVSLIPGLLLNLRESGSPNLDYKSSRVRPTSLRTSDRSSLLRYMGLPLRIFGKEAFFQPYMPLQQMDMLQAQSWLVGTTNQIVTQQKEHKYDLLVNIDNNTFAFSDSKLERIVALTPADRKWMDDVVQTVEESWPLSEGERPSFRGSDDDLRARFEEYILSALSSIKYADFITKGQASDISIIASGSGNDANVIQDFGEDWILAFKTTNVYEVWNGCTDPVLFDIHEPKHPCGGKVNVVSDLGLRLVEGLHDLHLDQQLAPTRDALSLAWTTGSTTLFKAFDGVRTEVSTRLREREESRQRPNAIAPPASVSFSSSPPTLTSHTTNLPSQKQAPDIRTTINGIGSGIGSFFGSKVASLRSIKEESTSSAKGMRPFSLSTSANAPNSKNPGHPEAIGSSDAGTKIGYEGGVGGLISRWSQPQNK